MARALNVSILFSNACTFAKRNIFAYNETAMKLCNVSLYAHLVETKSSIVLNIYLFCYAVKAYELLLRK